MSYKYFGMTTKSWEQKHLDQSGIVLEKRPQTKPLCFVTIDKPSEHPVTIGAYCMIARAADCHGKDMIPPMFLHADKHSLTSVPSEACEISLGWKYDRETDWRRIAADAIKQMASLARNSGITEIKEWYE